jgi:hypothetical protein
VVSGMLRFHEMITALCGPIQSEATSFAAVDRLPACCVDVPAANTSFAEDVACVRACKDPLLKD